MNVRGGMQHAAIKENITKEYYEGIRLVLKTEFSFKIALKPLTP